MKIFLARLYLIFGVIGTLFFLGFLFSVERMYWEAFLLLIGFIALWAAGLWAAYPLLKNK